MKTDTTIKTLAPKLSLSKETTARLRCRTSLQTGMRCYEKITTNPNGNCPVMPE